MIDMETLDTDPFCVVLTIGCVVFDPFGNGVTERLELRPTIEEQTEIHNRKISNATLDWWSQQSAEAIEEAMGDRDRISLRECAEKLYKFGWNRQAVWSNGAAFDVVVAETIFKQALTDYPNPIPWNFWTVRDTRTVYDLAKVSLKDGGHVTSHKAVDDAERQAIVVQQAYKKLGITK